MRELMNHFLKKMRTGRHEMTQHENMGMLFEQYFRSIEVFQGNKLTLLGSNAKSASVIE
jgi:hypothetical protein